MSLLVVLNFGKGSWQQGFPSITAQLGETGSATALKVTGSLPPAVEVVELYRRWRSLYLALSDRIPSDRIPSDRIPSDRIPSDRMMPGGLREAKPRAAGTAQPPTTLHTLQDTIEFDDGEPAQVSEVEFDDLCDRLESQFNRWLDCPSFGKIERRLRTKLGTDDEVRVAIETEDELLRHLPWHLWSFFEDYPQAELALSIPEYEHVKPSQPG
ncbi:MAG: hypothetical protein HC925_01585 [Coleofasciculaceae cyanobacterium SM2_3_26]|nr:hypothetical protein [Coleofasciculaceae cyanobacterium SM2_3_26]